MKVLSWVLAGLGLLVAAGFAASIVVSQPLFDERLDPARLDQVAIFRPDVALTLAVTHAENRPRVLLVKRYRDGKVTGVDLNQAFGTDFADALQAYRALGYDRLLAATNSPQAITVDAASLDLPFAAPGQNIGVGLNYREHARESALEEEPFLFPKFAQPTRWTSDVAKNGSTLLDYEAEIGLVALEDLDRSSPPRLGLVLANEMTDRWPLVRNIDRSQPMGTTGFADGKSREGFAPIGPLLVIPRDVEAFCAQVELELYVNGRLRQREKGSAMLWGPRRIVTEVFARAEGPYAYRDGSVGLLPDGGTRLGAGSVIFSGTPAGVIFRPLNLFNPWVYLRVGDEIVVRADGLGLIRNRIVD